MNKAFEKILDMLEEEARFYNSTSDSDQYIREGICISNRIVQGVAEEYNNGWIPCSERLPEQSLNSVIGWDEYRQRCCFVQYYGGRWILGNDIDSVKIIAWKPLPEPFKERD